MLNFTFINVENKVCIYIAFKKDLFYKIKIGLGFLDFKIYAIIEFKQKSMTKDVEHYL